MAPRPRVTCLACDELIPVSLDDVIEQRDLSCSRGHVRRLDEVSATALAIVADHEAEVRQPDGT